MIQADLSWLSQVLNTPVEKASEAQLQQTVQQISTDSRSLAPGQVFLALKGPNFDGHKFVEQAEAKGAIAVIVDHPQDVAIPQLVVSDTLTALGALGAAVARKVAPKTIAITGSVGKTSVKEMCAAILATKGKVLATAGNFNNEIGVPLTLLRLEMEHEYAVIELGANHIGEIANTTRLTQPDVAVLNNVAEAHLEGFGSLQGVVQAKGEIFEGLGETGVAIVNGDSEFKQTWLTALDAQFKQPGHVIEFSLADECRHPDSFSACNVVLNKWGCPRFELCYQGQQTEIQLNVAGRHNVANALAAASACYALGATFAEITEGLSNMSAVGGRVTLNPVSDSLLIIDDSYNANVQSVKAAIELLTSYPGTTMLVLGDMAELGHEAKRLHQEVGQYAFDQGLDYLFSFGVLSQDASQVFEHRGRHFSSKQSLIDSINQRIKQAIEAESDEAMVILVKGSRSAKMELVVQQLANDNRS